jgi:RNA polymerase sigma-70 factor (ECF subfamily)
VDDEASLRELASRAEGFISELPPAYRDVIWMNDVEQMSATEIADVLEISIPAFKSRLHRARLYVRQRLSEITRPPAQVAAEAAR